MTQPLAALRHSPLPGAVFAIWADYWVGLGGHIPPLCYYRTAPNGAVLCVVPLSQNRVAEFVEAHTRSEDFHFEAQGSALLEEWRWWGCWTLLSADRRRRTIGWRSNE